MTAIAGKTNYLENAVINHVLRNTALASPTTVYAALHQIDPAEEGTGTEVTGGSYVRKAVTFDAPSGGVTQNTGALEWTGMPATDVAGVAIWDDPSAGNMLYGALLTGGTVTVGAGNTFTIPIGSLTVTEL